MAEEQKQKQKVSVAFKSIDDHPKFKFTPDIAPDNFNLHFSNLMNNFVNSYMTLLSCAGIMRPATQEERDVHIYVFETDDQNDKEHQLYKARKFLYEQTAAAFEYVLTNTYPDIDYIKTCDAYHQDQAFNKPEENDDYHFDVETVVQNVRANYEKLCNPEELEDEKETSKSE